MSHYLQDLLTEVFRVEGTPEPERVAARAVEALMRVEVLPAQEVERFERDARIFELRGSGVSPCQLVLRFNLSRSVVFEAVRRHGKRRRNALRNAS